MKFPDELLGLGRRESRAGFGLVGLLVVLLVVLLLAMTLDPPGGDPYGLPDPAPPNATAVAGVEPW